MLASWWSEFVVVVLSILALFGLVPLETPAAVPEPAREVVAVVTVIDGDTIDVVRATGETVRVRYIGVDTPEPYGDRSPDCGAAEASAYNRELVEGGEVTLVSDVETEDQYGRLLRYVYVGDTFVNAALLQAGWADTMQIAPNTRHAREFRELRDAAKAAGVGVWGTCQDQREV